MKKKIKLIKIYLACACIILTCAACGSDDKKQASTKYEESGDNSTDEKATTSVEEQSMTSNKESGDVETSGDEMTSGDETASGDTETSLEDVTTSDNKETTSSKVESTTTKKGTSGEKQTTTKSSTEKNTRPVMEDVTFSDEPEHSSGNGEDELTVLVNKILKKCINSSMSEVQKVLAIHDYLTYNVDYDYDNYLAGTIPWESYTALGALKNGRAVCDGYAKAFRVLATAAGLEVKRVTGVANGGGHAWNQVKVDGVWYNIDVTWDDPTWVGKKPNEHMANGYNYFLVSDATLEADHTPYSAKESCPKDLSVKSFYNALMAGNSSKKSIYVESKAELRTKILEHIKNGNTTFDIYMSYDMLYQLGLDQDWDELYKVFDEVKAPVNIDISEDVGNRIRRFRIVEPENTYVVTSPNELITVINNNKKINDVEIWYYDARFNEEFDAYGMINEEILKAGLLYEINTSYLQRTGKYVVSLKPIENAILIKDLTELKTYLQNKSLEELYKTNIIYAGKVEWTDLEAAINEALVKTKGCLLESYTYLDGDETKRINILGVKKVTYVEKASQISDFLNANGADAVTYETFVAYCGTDDPYSCAKKLVLEASLLSDCYMVGSISYNEQNGYVHFWIGYAETEAYVSNDLTGLKADIEDAISKGTVNTAAFYYLDMTIDFVNTYNAANELIASTGCNVKLSYTSTDFQNYYVFYLTQN